MEEVTTFELGEMDGCESNTGELLSTDTVKVSLTEPLDESETVTTQERLSFGLVAILLRVCWEALPRMTPVVLFVH